MEQIITGKAYVLGNDIDTDQIIPAKYLSFNPSIPEERKMFGKYALCGIPKGQKGYPDGDIDFVKEPNCSSEYSIIITGKNFGCGSSREHAPLALEQAGVKVVVAESFARIFFRNCVNGGYVVPYQIFKSIVSEIKTGDNLEINTIKNLLINITTGKNYELNELGDVRAIFDAGDIFEYAKQCGNL